MRESTLMRMLPPARRDMRTWPKVHEEALRPELVAQFRLNRKAVSALLAGASYAAIKEETGYRPGRVRYLLCRCAMPDGENDILGERGLVPFVHAVPYKRKKPIIRKPGAGRGHCAGAMATVFDAYPEIEQDLEKTVLKLVPEGRKLCEVRISTAAVHERFLQLCTRAGLKESGAWPFNTWSLGRSSVRLYITKLSLKRPEDYISANCGQVAATMLKVGVVT